MNRSRLCRAVLLGLVTIAIPYPSKPTTGLPGTPIAAQHDAPLRSAGSSSAGAYLGFDRNDYPGAANLAILRKTFSYAGYWLNPPPGARDNTWVGKRRTLESAGFGFLVLFNGRRYAQIKSGNAAGMGRRDAQSAMQAARQEGFPPGTIIFLDQEQGGRLLREQKDYLYAWVDGVNSSGFQSGVYCSGIPFQEGGGARIVTAEDIRAHAGGRKIVYWVFNDQCGPSPGCSFAPIPTPKESGVGFADIWQYAQSPRRPEMTAACGNTYSADGNCYPPGIKPETGLQVDVNAATSKDPSHGRSR
jgi:hypothetical protein